MTVGRARPSVKREVGRGRHDVNPERAPDQNGFTITMTTIRTSASVGTSFITRQ